MKIYNAAFETRIYTFRYSNSLTKKSINLVSDTQGNYFSGGSEPVTLSAATQEARSDTRSQHLYLEPRKLKDSVLRKKVIKKVGLPFCVTAVFIKCLIILYQCQKACTDV